MCRVVLCMFSVALVGVLAMPAGSQLRPAEEPKPTSEVPKDNVKMDDASKKAVDKALKYLAEKQETDGSWGNTAITGFVLLAFMANGHMPNQGDHGKVVAKGHPLPLFEPPAIAMATSSAARGGNMYCHGMATLALTQSLRHDRGRGREESHQAGRGTDRQDAEPRRRLAVRTVADRRGHLRHHHAGDGAARCEGRGHPRPGQGDGRRHQVREQVLR